MNNKKQTHAEYADELIKQGKKEGIDLTIEESRKLNALAKEKRDSAIKIANPPYRSVILLNQKEMTYAIVGMNYLPEEAKEEVKKLWEGENQLPAMHVDQHRKFATEKELEDLIKNNTKGKFSRVDL